MKMIKYTILAWIIFLSNSISSQTVTYEMIHFTDDGTVNGNPLLPGFSMNSCWGAIGYHHSGKIYIAVSDHLEPGNTAFFKYDPLKNKMSYIGDVKSICTQANNWMIDESQQKIHTHLFEHADGKMYCATHDNSYDAILSNHRGSHIFTIDSEDQITDYSATSRYYIDETLHTVEGNIGVSIKNYGIIAMGVNPRVPHLVYGITYPDAYLIVLDLTTGNIRKVQKTSNSATDYISRHIAVDNNGNAYVVVKTNNTNHKQIYKYTYNTEQWTTIGNPMPDDGSNAKRGGFVYQVYSPSGDTMYAVLYNGDIYRLIFASNTLEKLGSIGQSNPPTYNLTLSKDGKFLYYIFYKYGKPDFELRKFDIISRQSSVIQSNLTNIFGSRDLIYGTTEDNYGNMYVAGWTYNTLNIVLMKMHFGTDYIASNPPVAIWESLSEKPPVEIPGCTLMQNYPNPFHTTTHFKFQIDHPCNVSLQVFNLYGSEIATIISEDMMPGIYIRQWNALNLPGGFYFYRFQAGTFTETKKMIHQK
ncbi:MAG: T9SS type A sorting domain-containing protein [Mariniphaga sp.]|nr:T9SS type A sorting domain-containing protein [Mariniphaga sp.]